MNELNKITGNLELIKANLIILNEIYDEIFKPWIVVKVEKAATEDIEFDKNSTDLNLLYKLQNVLIKASSVKDKFVKEINPIIERKISTSVSEKLKSSENKKSIKTDIELNSKVDLPNKQKPSQKQLIPKAKFIPAHKTAPFKTDPSLHHKKSKINVRNRLTSSEKNLRPPSEKVLCQNQSIDKTQIIPLETQLKVDQEKSNTLDIKSDTKNVGQILSQLQEDIERMREVSTDEVKIDSPKFEMKTLFEAKDKLIIPCDFKTECRMYSKLMSKLSSLYLERLNRDSPNNPRKFMESFLKLRENPMQLIALETHRIVIVHNVLEQIVNIIKLFDLESCTITQIGFMQACLSWILKEYIDIKSKHSQVESIDIQLRSHSNSSYEIRQWLDDKIKLKKSSDEMHKCAIKSVFLTNCPFVKAAEVKRNQPFSLTVPHFRIPPFKFITDNNQQILEHIDENELAIRDLITQQQFRLSLTPLIGKWVQEFKERYKQGDSSSSSYRQIYGLFLEKYPVILKEMS